MKLGAKYDEFVRLSFDHFKNVLRLQKGKETNDGGIEMDCRGSGESVGFGRELLMNMGDDEWKLGKRAECFWGVWGYFSEILFGTHDVGINRC